MNIDNSWIKIYRSMINWEWFTNPLTLQLFIYCLFRANFEDTTWQGISIYKGSFITSYDTLRNDTKQTLQQLRTNLLRLQRTREITVKSTNKYTIITICKYEDYQSIQQTNNKPITNQQQTNNKQITTDKNIKKEKKDNNSLNIPNGIFAKKEEFENVETSTLESENPEKEEKIATKEEKKKFVIPTIEEIEEYCKERNNGVSATTFWHFYNAKEWFIGKNKMKSWKSCIITWETSKNNNQSFSNQNNNQQSKPLSIREQRARELLGGQRYE